MRSGGLSLLIGFVAAISSLMLSLGQAFGQTDTLQLNALTQEGDLLLDERTALEPLQQNLVEQGDKLRAEEKSLRAEVQAVNDGINTFNSTMDAFNDDAKAHKAACTEQTKEANDVAACNERAGELRDRAQKLDAERAQLIARQEDINKRVRGFNATSAEFNKRKQEGDAQTSASDRDVQEWLTRVREFFLSSEFKTMSAGVSPIPACDESSIGSLGTARVAQALKQAQTCLKAMQAALR
ncbi:MAG: hypothetical protein C5B46_03655 [Proteobacteria bacterium]|nr:MAG: hypothetical protein C5B46_03655 [Pseudomonadota bacterium]